MNDNKNNTREIEYYKFMSEKFLNMFFIAAQSFDKAILTLSVSAMGFISAYIHIMNAEYTYACFAILALLFFIITSAFILINFIFLEDYALSKFSKFSNLYFNDKNNGCDSNKTGKYLRIFQWIALSSFILGMIMFFIFFICNSK